MRRIQFVTLAFVLPLWVCAGSTLAQEGGWGGGGWGGGGGGWGGPGPGGGGWGGGGFGRGGWGGGRRGRGGGPGGTGFMDQMLARMDANQNGQLDPEEVQGRARAFLEQTGLDLSQPVKIDDLRQRLAERMGRGRGGPEGGGEGAAPAEREPSGAPAGDSGAAGPATAALLVPAFGASVPGFGAATVTVGSVVMAASGSGATASAGPAASRPGSAATSGATGADGGADGGSSGGSSETSGSAAAPRSDDERTRRYAQSLLRQYDDNEDGVLQEDEWREIRGNPQEGDANGDGQLTLEELTSHLAAWGQGQQGSGGGQSGGAQSGGGQPGGNRAVARGAGGGSTGGPRKTYRFRSAIERLPSGLPSWFARSDADGDGQVAMAEYALSWTADKAREFSRYDLDGDGMVTPREALAAD